MFKRFGQTGPHKFRGPHILIRIVVVLDIFLSSLSTNNNNNNNNRISIAPYGRNFRGHVIRDHERMSKQISNPPVLVVVVVVVR